MKKIIIAILALFAIIAGIFGVTKAKEVYKEEQHHHYQEVICLYGCPSAKRKLFKKNK